MYYEEKVTDSGVLHWRGAPDGKWIQVNYSELIKKYLRVKQESIDYYRLIQKMEVKHD